MLSKIPGIFLVFLLFNNAYAQKSSLAGTVVGNDNKPLENAPVMVLRAKDSIMVTYTRTNSEGKFSFKNLSDTARFILFFSYPQYVGFTYKIDMKDAKNGAADVGIITMPLKAILLQEVLVKSQVSAIKIKGDTTEYDADSFKVQPHAAVEELLKQLPGLQVDQQGNITAQGKRVKKVLVDGEEFFSDDPTLVTRNLRADMIDKVQVYDKKSDAAAFTGIEDGVKDKTINLKIKEDKNHGLFGKADAGAGPEHYNGKGMLNLFKGKRKASVFASGNNVGASELGFGDQWRTGAEDEANNIYSGKGLPRVTSGGMHYDNKWNKDKESINGNYNFSVVRVRGNASSVSQNNLPSGVILSLSNSDFSASGTAHKGNAKYIQKPDTTLTFTAFASGSFQRHTDRSESVSENRRGDRSLLYNNQSSSYDERVQSNLNLRLSWEKKFKKKGRTLAFYLDDDFSKNATRGESLSSSEFFDENNKSENPTFLNLRKNTGNHSNTLNFRAIYTEPLSKKLSLLFNYGLRNEGGQDDKRSYDLNEQAAPALNTAFSTLMNSVTWGWQGGAELHYSAKKLKWNIGNNLQAVRMNMESLYDAMSLKKKFVNWNPVAFFQYEFNQYKSFNISYSGNSNNPSRTELMPFKYDNNQLAVYATNPDLKNSFDNHISLSYNLLQMIPLSFFGINVGYDVVTDPIVTDNTVSSLGVYAYRNINLTGYSNKRYSFETDYSSDIKFINNMRLTGGVGYNGGTEFSAINGAVNELTHNNPELTLSVSYRKENLCFFRIGGKLGYSFNKSSLQPDIRNNYFNYTLNPSARIYMPKKWELDTDADYFWQEKSQAFADNFNRLTWNAGIGRKFLKEEQLTISFSVHDILNQNNGYSRTASTTFYSENRYTAIRRFFLISLLWNFAKFYAPKQ